MDDAMQVQKFVFAPTNEVRVVMMEEEPWFVAKDACDILGIDTNHVKETVGNKRFKYLNLRCTEVWNGRGHAPLLVNESGLYKLIMRSNKPEAEKFQNWIADEVLPSIRKHGAYLTPQTAQSILDNPDNAIVLAKALIKEHDERLRVEAERDEAIRRKGEISNEREAKVLGMYGSLVKKQKMLEIETEAKSEEIQKIMEKNRELMLELQNTIKALQYKEAELKDKCSHKKRSNDTEDLL